jgi:hypothetical protein
VECGKSFPREQGQSALRTADFRHVIRLAKTLTDRGVLLAFIADVQDFGPLSQSDTPQEISMLAGIIRMAKMASNRNGLRAINLHRPATDIQFIAGRAPSRNSYCRPTPGHPVDNFTKRGTNGMVSQAVLVAGEK